MTSGLYQTFSLTLVVILGYMFITWIVATIRSDASVVDPLWGTGFALIAWVAVLTNGTSQPRPLILAILISIWGPRLSGYLLWRNWGRPEDHRYAAMRAYQGQRFWWLSLVTVFVLQGVLLWFISWPIQVACVQRLAVTVHGPGTDAFSWRKTLNSGHSLSTNSPIAHENGSVPLSCP